MKNINKYARLIIRTGVNIQEHQTLIIRSQIDNAHFARLCMKEAYEAGARDVFIYWTDDLTARLRYEHTATENLVSVEPWIQAIYKEMEDKECAYLMISSSNPENLNGIDTNKISTYNKAISESLESFYDKMMSNKLAWCVASMPSLSWAKKVFPGLSDTDAMERLLEAILIATRADTEDPVKAWAEQESNFNHWLSMLNGNRFKSLKYKNSLGSDFTIDLAPNHIWYGGADTHIPSGYKFIANLPTEEVYTAPHKDGVNGRVVSSKPLSHHGQLIEDFWFEFKNGLVVDFGARTGKDVLTDLFESDPTAKQLGEVALVPYDSPISNMNIMFYNTLFDENASCHLALGAAYPICIEGGEDMTKEEKLAASINVSQTHIDFMIGTSDLQVIGIQEDGTEMPVFVNGNFAF